MRDHPSHAKYPISGGMWGGTHPAIPNIIDLLREGHLSDAYVADMDFLTTSVWAKAQASLLQHDSFSCVNQRYAPYGIMKSFPSKRVGGEHIGSVHMDKCVSSFSAYLDVPVACCLLPVWHVPVACDCDCARPMLF